MRGWKDEGGRGEGVRVGEGGVRVSGPGMTAHLHTLNPISDTATNRHTWCALNGMEFTTGNTATHIMS